MIVRKSVFSRMCNVSRQSITELSERGTITLTTDGKIDLTVPRNLAYLAKHNPQSAIDVQSGIYAEPKPTEPQPTTPKVGRPRKSKPPEQSTETDALMARIKRGTEKARIDDAEARSSLSEELDKAQATGALTPAEINETLRKSLYDAQKAKAEAQLKAVALDKEHGSLGELEMFDSFVTELWQSIQRNMLDVITKQSALVCKRLGTVGKELEVIDVLEGDMKKRMDNVAREVQSILNGKLSHRVTEVPAE